MSNFNAIDLLKVLKATSLGSSGLFAGAAIYCSYVQHPALMVASPKEMVNQFQVFFPRAATMQAALAVTSVIATVGATYLTKRQIFLIPAGLFGGTFAFTMLSIKPVYNQLLSMKVNNPSPNVESLIRSWGEKHFVRTILSTVGFGVLLFEVCRN
ncbi:hypothetical protein K7432_009194 [Basidiobolus ranarum]|uniref:DUF1772 domain-containing protein n=1 Tax=Basidiobolus ranarum TaxID=34480 RepID=A0ABR2VXE8_9FUNG